MAKKGNKDLDKKVFVSLVIILIGLLVKWAFDNFCANNCFNSNCSLSSFGLGGFIATLIYSLIKWRFG